jgi:lipopolysaccharide transport system permease protein
MLKVIRPIDDRHLFEEVVDLWRSRGLLAVLIKRDIAVRYRQAAIGVLWALIQPIATTAVFSLIFVIFVRLPTQELPYPVFAFGGLVIWQYFNRAVSEGTLSLVANSALITKVYFPRLVIPLVPPASAAVDCILGTVALVLVAFIFGVDVRWTVVIVPFVILLVGLLGYAIALCLAPLHALYRDVGLLLPFTLQIVMYLSPIVYPTNIVPESVRWLYRLNPLAVVVDTMRWALVGSEPPSLAGVGFTLLLTAALFWCGLRLFRTFEGTLVDRI